MNLEAFTVVCLSSLVSYRHKKLEISDELEPQPPRKLRYFYLSDFMLHLSIVNFQETPTLDENP
ncbi:hypothetical protein COLO4_03305 [Corchorus olitorius]|uniref:Uncharacterized protein n=1 Tax=Corchorus olitorius TaxID=93759 RepID=A0A1R3KYY5_9ROSI|nr:hypothetical protein COLO4_03305 [Corchorus olitorius]